MRETVTIKISKVSEDGPLSHWDMEVIDINGNTVGGATGPTFASVFDTAYEMLNAETLPVLPITFTEDPDE